MCDRCRRLNDVTMEKRTKKQNEPTTYQRVKVYFGFGKETAADEGNRPPQPQPPPAVKKESSLKKRAPTSPTKPAPTLPTKPAKKPSSSSSSSSSKKNIGVYDESSAAASVLHQDDEVDAEELDAMVAAEVAKAKAKFVKPPSVEPKPLPPQYAAEDAPLKPMEKRQKLHKWMEPPDITPAEGVREPNPSRAFVLSEHATHPHAKLHHVPLADRTYARYPPGKAFCLARLAAHTFCLHAARRDL